MKRMCFYLVTLLGAAYLHGGIGYNISQVGSLTSMPPSAPRLLWPSTAQSRVPADFTASWHVSQQAGSYCLQLSRDESFTDVVLVLRDLRDSTASLTGLTAASHYYWRVCAFNRAGQGEFSLPNEFWTMMALPVTPVTLSPADSAEQVRLDGQLVWTEVTGAVCYTLQISLHPDFAQLFADINLASGRWQMNGLSHLTRYYWRVCAGNAEGGCSEFSEIRSFTTLAAAPGRPILRAPQNGSRSLAMPPLLVWAVVPGAERYEIEISICSDFASSLRESVSVDTLCMVDSLAFNENYYWRIRSLNQAGVSDYSEIWSFHTQPRLPAAPELLFPPNIAQTAPVEIEFRWNAIAGAEFYRLQISRFNDFGIMVLDQLDLAENRSLVTGLQKNIEYFWRVSAGNAGGSSPFSEIWRFRTAATGFSELQELRVPDEFRLDANYPNPFNDETVICFSLPQRVKGFVRLAIYNDKGQLIKILYDSMAATGCYRISWDGRDRYGEALSSGVYICWLHTGSRAESIKMIKLR